MPSILNNLNLLKKYDIYAAITLVPSQKFWTENKFDTRHYKNAVSGASGRYFDNIKLKK